MTEREIQLLGFEREDMNDGDYSGYYYAYRIANGFEFLSNANDEIGEGEQSSQTTISASPEKDSS
jgi:hypothetical protein